MKAVLLAAGEGTRLRPHTLERPKCLVELGGRSLLDHQIAVLLSRDIHDLHIVTGYRSRQLEARGYPTFHNPDFDKTNMVTSLMCAADLFDGSADVIVAYADIVYEARVLDALCSCPAQISTTIDEQWLRLWQIRGEDPLADAETLRIDAAGNIVELGRKPRSIDVIEGQYMGLIKVRADFGEELVRIHRELDPAGDYDGRDLENMYMTSFLQHLIDHGRPVQAVRVQGGWLEVDTASDLALYRRLLSENSLDRFCRLDVRGGSTTSS
jgi:choline kinase